MRRLVGTEQVDPDDLLGGVDFAALAPSGRPYVVVNMVASADGRATLDGNTEKLGNDADRAMFHALRASVDAVMVGTGTLRAERYGALIKSDERRALRRERGLEADPLAIVVSRSGDFPTDVPLLGEPRVLAHTGTAAEALHRAREEHGVRSVLCEGGPTLNAAMLADGLIDELFMTLAPLLAGGAEPVTIFSDGAPTPLELRWALEGDGALFLRYAVTGSG